MEKKEQAGYELQLIELRKRLLREVDSSEVALREDVVKPGRITNLPTHPADEDVEGLDSEIAISQNDELLLEQVVAAIERIRVGTYGICQQCGRTIATERLKAVPYTACCIECARGEREQIEMPVRGEPRRFR
jgi:RNA polymerase-binding protein DksA